jgi:hypothetical protein
VLIVSMLTLWGAALIGAVRLAGSTVLQRAVRSLSPHEALCLTAGAALMSADFFVRTSTGYRAVLLLFALPGLLAMGRVAASGRFTAFLRWTVAAALVVMWSLPVQRLIRDAFGRYWTPEGVIAHPLGTLLPGAGFWLLREALWWWLMTVLLAIALRAVFDSPVAEDTRRWLRHGISSPALE